MHVFLICVKTQGPLSSDGPSIYLIQVFIQLKSNDIAIMNQRKQGRVLRNSIFSLSDKSLIYIKNNNGPSINPPGNTCFNIRPDRDLGHLIKVFVFYLSKNYIKDLVNYHIHHFVSIKNEPLIPNFVKHLR